MILSFTLYLLFIFSRTFRFYVFVPMHAIENSMNWTGYDTCISNELLWNHWMFDARCDAMQRRGCPRWCCADIELCTVCVCEQYLLPMFDRVMWPRNHSHYYCCCCGCWRWRWNFFSPSLKPFIFLFFLHANITWSVGCIAMHFSLTKDIIESPRISTKTKFIWLVLVVHKHWNQLRSLFFNFHFIIQYYWDHILCTAILPCNAHMRAENFFFSFNDKMNKKCSEYTWWNI